MELIRAMRFVFILLVCQSAGAVSYHQNLYSEHAVVDREERFSSSVRVRGEAEVVSWFSPYLQMGSELSIPTYQMNNMDNFSYGYAAPGIKFGYGPFALYNEARFRGYYKQSGSVGQSTADYRSLFVYGDFFSFPIAASTFLFRFAEPYSETLFSSADKNNITNSTSLRLGVRGAWTPKTFTDVFVEPYVTLDTARHFYNNRTDVKLSLRIMQQIDPIQISLISSVLYNAYFSRGDFERNPYPNRSPGVKFLLAVGGDF